MPDETDGAAVRRRVATCVDREVSVSPRRVDVPHAMNSDQRALADLFSATSLRQPEDSVGFLLWRVAHRHQREIDRACAALDLTHLQHAVLMMSAWLGRSGERVGQSGLAAFSGIHPMQLSNVLKTLEEKGLIARARSDADTRVKHVTVTA